MPNRGSYFILKNIPTSEFVYPKKFLSAFFCNPKKSFCFFFRNPKNSSIFRRQKKSLLAKISDQKNYLTHPPPPTIKICEWGPWGGATLRLGDTKIHYLKLASHPFALCKLAKFSETWISFLELASPLQYVYKHIKFSDTRIHSLELASPLQCRISSLNLVLHV